MTHLPIYNSDINAWITFNNYFNSQKEYLSISLNSSNPPTVNQYTRFNFYKTTSATLLSTVATGNAEYSAGATITYLTNEAIYEDLAARTFTWNTGNFPNSTNLTASTYYLYCCGSTNQGSSSIGWGCYGVSTANPTYSYQKGGWYSTDNNRILASFIFSTASTIGTLNIFQGLGTLPNINDAVSSTSYSTSAYFLMQTTSNEYYKTIGSNLPANKTYSTFSSTWTKYNNIASQAITINHNLAAFQPDLITKIYFSTVGSDTNMWEPIPTHGGYNAIIGFGAYSDSSNAFILYTGSQGLARITTAFNHAIVSTVWMKVGIYKL